MSDPGDIPIPGEVTTVTTLTRAQLIRASAVSLPPKTTLDKLKALGRDPALRRKPWIRICLKRAMGGLPLSPDQASGIEREWQHLRRLRLKATERLRRQGDGSREI